MFILQVPTTSLIHKLKAKDHCIFLVEKTLIWSEIWKNISDNKRVALQQFIYTTDLKKVCATFLDEINCINNTNAYIKYKMCQTKHFALKFVKK